MLHLLGIDHEKLTYRFQGRQFPLTDVHGQVVKGILAEIKFGSISATTGSMTDDQA